MKKFCKQHSLSLTLAALTLACLGLQAWFGWQVDAGERLQAGRQALSFFGYLASGAFVSATFENWESEFLQMGMYVLLTVKLHQRGSAESRPLDPSQEHPRIDAGPQPWPVRKGGLWKTLYGHSLSAALLLLFVASFALHLSGSWRHALDAGDVAAGTTRLEYLAEPRFWFESMQNWQSEFMAVFALVMLSIFLRQKNSPESKPVAAPHRQTGR